LLSHKEIHISVAMGNLHKREKWLLVPEFGAAGSFGRRPCGTVIRRIRSEGGRKGREEEHISYD
jgi:hypothetical protein